MSEAGTLKIISGVGAKGPACFLLEAQGKRLMLDLGYGPQPGLWPNVDDVGRVDALLLSHSHKDHIGGLSLLPKIGNPPIFATEITAKRLPAGTKVNPLPLKGRGDVLGIPVDTGRNGHAPGGIWMRFHGGTGLLYTGDYSTESALYAFDPLPKSRTVAVRLLLWRRRHAARRAPQDTRAASRGRRAAAGAGRRPRAGHRAASLPRRQDDPLRRCDARGGARSDRAARATTCATASSPTSRSLRRRRCRPASRPARRSRRPPTAPAARPRSCSSNGRTSRSRRSCSPATSRPARPPIGW